METIAINWKPFQNKILRGTPINAAGEIANNGTAIGIVSEDTDRPNAAPYITSGEWDEEINYCGFSLTDECKRALPAINFVGTDGERHPVSTLPEPTLAAAGKVGAVNEDGTAYELGDCGGGGLPPVTGSGKALVSVDGQWKQQEGFPYKSQQEEATIIDCEFSDFVRKEEEEYEDVYLDSYYNEESEHTVAADETNYYYISDNVHDYSIVQYADVSDFGMYTERMFDIEFYASGEIAKADIPYSFESDGETVSGTLHFASVPVDGAADENGVVFEAAGLYLTMDIVADRKVGISEAELVYSGLSNYWTSEAIAQNLLPGESGDYTVFVNGEEGSGWYDPYENLIFLDPHQVNSVTVYEQFDEETQETIKVALCSLYAADLPEPPDTLFVKMLGSVSGVTTMDSEFIPWDEMPSDAIPWSEAPEGTGFPDAYEFDNGTALIAVDGEWIKQPGYGYLAAPQDAYFLEVDLNNPENGDALTIPDPVNDPNTAIGDAIIYGEDITPPDGAAYHVFVNDVEVDIISIERNEVLVLFIGEITAITISYDGEGTSHIFSEIDLTEYPDALTDFRVRVTAETQEVVPIERDLLPQSAILPPLPEDYTQGPFVLEVGLEDGVPTLYWRETNPPA